MTAKQFLIVLSGILILGKSFGASNTRYSVASVPDSLKENADAVIRIYEEIFTVKSIGSATRKVRKAVTVLNENGDNFALLIVGYDKLSKVNYVKGELFNSLGMSNKKLKKSDIKDFSAVSGFSLYEDNRVKYCKPTGLSYPYTVEYEYETTSNNLLFYPTWQPVDSERISLESSTFQIIMPVNLELRYSEKNLTDVVKISSEGNNKIHTWFLQGLPAVEQEYAGPSLSEIVPTVYTAPSRFEVEGHKGNMGSWESFGRWSYELNKGRDILSDAVKEKVREITTNLNNDTEKAKAVYEFLQNNTRYVSIQMGIGGWQTFEASTVENNGYGDCKALTNYARALLNTIGIKSYYTLIRAGKYEPDIMQEFPSNQFNHATLCIPGKKDSAWLECTGQKVPFGYAGYFTGNRHALMITENGGKLVRTPYYSKNINTQKRNAEIALDSEGNGAATIYTKYSGIQYENVSENLHLNEEDQKKELYDAIDIPDFEIKSVSYTQKKDRVPVANEKISLYLKRYGSKTGKRMFIMPNLMNRSRMLPPEIKNRKTEIIIKTGFVDTDTIIFKLPEGYKPEYLPKPVSFNAEFGKYETMCNLEDDNTLIYTRTFTVNDNTYPPESYEAFREFFRAVAKNDTNKVVLVRD